IRTYGQGEDVRFVSREEQRALAGGIHTKHFAPVCGSQVNILLPTANERQGQIFVRTKDSVSLRCQCQFPIFADGTTRKGSLEEIVKRPELPETRFECCQRQ